MKPTPLMLVNVVLAVVLLSSIVLMTASTTSANQYDPWIDVNGDGVINIQDAALMGLGWQAGGDPTRNVNVMNWPVTNQKTVFWNKTADAYSDMYNASGFGHMHLTFSVSGLVDPESVHIYVFAWIFDQASGWSWGFAAQTIDATNTYRYGALNLAVPSEIFSFRVYFEPGTTATVSVAFYLTYA